MDLREYTMKANMSQLSPEQQKFIARRIVQEAQKIAESLGISEEAAYELYIKGSTRPIGDYFYK